MRNHIVAIYISAKLFEIANDFLNHKPDLTRRKSLKYSLHHSTSVNVAGKLCYISFALVQNESELVLVNLLNTSLDNMISIVVKNKSIN